MIQLEIVSTLSRLEALAPEWDALADRSPSPLVRHAWFLAAARTYAANSELTVFTARRDGRLRAIAPMVVDRSGLTPRLRMLGFQSPEPEAFLADDDEALEAVCSAVLSTGRAVVLPRLDAGSPEWRLLNELARRKGLAVPRPALKRYYMTVLQPDWAEFEAGMARKKRSDLKRRRNQLAEHGEIAFDVVSPDEDGVEAAFAELVRVEAASWKSGSRTAMVNRPLLEAFMREYARQAARQGKLRISTLRLNGQPIAVLMDVEHGGRLWGLKMGVDDRWAKYGPGVLGTHELIRWAVGRGLNGCEHLGEAEDWQRRWPFEERELSAFNFYPPSAAAAVALGRDLAGVAGRAAKRRLQRATASPPPAKRAA
ncbi:MAG: GNAT family N-acetyltransferase [Proteobacteria bacterium]|nr:GNAT family N-acetyltransferase [Pseudomonadota bacterium]